MGAIAIGLASGVGCFLAATKLKGAMGYDDSLDVFGVHAVGGIIGAMLTGIFAAVSLGGAGFGDGNETMLSQVIAQFVGVSATVIYTGIMSIVILFVIKKVIGLRVSAEEESEGLDLALHDERGYIL